jgi:tetratricopeptide (TPR) repeat protein
VPHGKTRQGRLSEDGRLGPISGTLAQPERLQQGVGAQGGLPMRRIVTGIAILLLLGAAAKPQKTDPREQTARAFFAAGKYQEAIDIYSQLFAQYVHPMYIYNIGRCQQNMGSPDKALASFREFLRKEKKITPALKQEIDGHIKEMEELKKQQQLLTERLGAVAPPVAPPAAGPPVVPVPAKPGQPPEPANPVAEETQEPAPKGAKPEPDNPVAAYLAKLHAQHEPVWRARAKKPDDAKAEKVENLLRTVPANDPRVAKYELFLGNLYAGKHFFLRLQELEKDGQVKSEGEGKQVGAGGARALGPEINASFLKAAEHYVAAGRVPKFEQSDTVLLGLGVLLEANGMEARAKSVLERLLKNYPDSKAAKEVLAGDVTKPEAGE